jgi:type I restriction enzyme R subunit
MLILAEVRPPWLECASSMMIAKRRPRDETQRALDLVLFINGLPVFTFELKNRLTKQTVHDAIEQYRRDRNPREKLFELGRCVAHFAVDDNEVWFCTHLAGKASWFLPFNKGWNDGAGNPPDPQGLKTAYLWREILTRESLTDILENYAQLVEEKDLKTGKKRRRQIFPRYHQLDVVRKLLADAAAHGVGRRYLIQHSAGSGKSNSIAWLAHQLIGLARDGRPVFDSIMLKGRLARMKSVLRSGKRSSWNLLPEPKVYQTDGFSMFKA